MKHKRFLIFDQSGSCSVHAVGWVRWRRPTYSRSTQDRSTSCRRSRLLSNLQWYSLPLYLLQLSPCCRAAHAEAPAVGQPTKLNIAIATLFLEEAWTTGLLQSLEKVIAEKPHGLEITYHVLEEVTFDNVGMVLDQAAATGEFRYYLGAFHILRSCGSINERIP